MRSTTTDIIVAYMFIKKNWNFGTIPQLLSVITACIPFLKEENLCNFAQALKTSENNLENTDITWTTYMRYMSR